MKLTWNQVNEKLYETGVKKGVLYLPNTLGKYINGVAWNGLRSVDESPEGAEPTKLYADDSVYLVLTSDETFKFTLGAYMSPAEFDQCDGSATLGNGVTIGQQSRKMFGLSYITTLGNDTEGNDFAYIIHLVYGCKASPSGRTYNSVNDSPEAVELSWEVNTTPVEVEGFKPTAHLKIRSDKLSPSKLATLLGILHGTDSEAARLPLPDEIKEIIDGEDQKYTVTLSKTGSGTVKIDGNVISSASIELVEGNHEIDATPESGYHITSAKKGTEDISLPHTFALTEAVTFTFAFEADTARAKSNPEVKNYTNTKDQTTK